MCACMRACVHMCVFGIGLHADELQPVFTPRVQAWWVVVGGVHLCEDARVGGEPLKASAWRRGTSCKVPRPHQDFREAVVGWGPRGQRAERAQVDRTLASPVLEDFKRPGPLSAPSGKGHPIAAPYPLPVVCASGSSLLSPFEQWLAAGWGERRRAWIWGLPGHLGRGRAEGNGGFSQGGEYIAVVRAPAFLPT